MTMISPEMFIEEYENKSYEELLPVRDELIEGIRSLEKSGDSNTYPGNTRYQFELKYLGKLCELIAEKFNDKQWETDL